MTEAAVEELPCGPAPDGHDRPYWEGLAAGRLVLPRCGKCGTWRALGRVLCAACWSFETEWSDVEPRGTVYTWIRTHRDFMSELDVRAPYVTALVELADAPVRLLGLVRADAADPAAVAIGTELRGVIEQPANAPWPVLRWEA